MFSNSRRLSAFTALAGLVILALIVLFYQSFDLPIAKAAHILKGTFAVSIGTLISDIASKHVIQTISFITLIAGSIDTMLYGLSTRSKALLLIALSTITAMLIGDELKWFFGRYRPPMYFKNGSYGFTWFSDRYLQNSFPSGHSLRAFSIATSAALLLPKKKYIPLLIAALVALSRVIVGKHYPADIIFGSFIGATCAVWSYYFIFQRNTKKE